MHAYVMEASSLPDDALEAIFSYLEIADIRNISLVCRSWNAFLLNGNNEVWKTLCFKRMNHEVRNSALLSICPTFKDKVQAHAHSWNDLDCSRNIFITRSGFTMHRNPVSNRTDAVRGKIGFDRGFHVWDVIWETPFLGTVAMVGVATKQAELTARGYIPLIGVNDQSFGWNLVDNVVVHNGRPQGKYPTALKGFQPYQVGERIRVILDCEGKTLSFFKDSEFLGVAFHELPKGVKLYPVVSAVYGHTEVSMVYLGGIFELITNHAPRPLGIDQAPTTEPLRVSSSLCSTAIQPPISVLHYDELEAIFSFLELADLRNAFKVCRSWNRVISYENSEIWRTQCLRRMSNEVMSSELLSVCSTYKSKLLAQTHAWSPSHHASNISVTRCGFTMHRNSPPGYTSGIRGKIGFNQGVHEWDVIWGAPLGRAAVVGVVTRHTDLRPHPWIVGEDNQSWGWCIIEKVFMHEGRIQENPLAVFNTSDYQVGERLNVILDCDSGIISFWNNIEFLGAAFGLPKGEKLYPAASVAFGEADVSIVYRGGIIR